MLELDEDLVKLTTNIFDNKLDNINDELFKKLIDTTGVLGCVELANKINYIRKDEIINEAVNYSFYMWSKQKQPKIEYVFGCRHPDSEKESWDRAFIVTKPVGCSVMITSALYNNNMDYLGHPLTYNKALVSYNKYIKKGWKPMSVDDLKKTCGVQIDIDTLTQPVQSRKRKPLLIAGAITIALSMFFIIK